jgi:thioredoxin reductase (NADPH)
MYDIIIIGAGPAGITAGIFAARRDLRVLILGDPNFLPTITEATIVDDYPGVPNLRGPELQKMLEDHAKKFGIEFMDEKTVKVEKLKNGFSVLTSAKKRLQAKTIIFATGAKHRNVGVPGEKEFAGRGVSYCANCDGPMFKGKKVVVVGGGDSALTSALLLHQIGAKVTIMHRRDEFRAVEEYRKQVKKSGMPVLWNTVPREIRGGQFVKSVVVQNAKTKETKEIEADGVFIHIGTVPTSELAGQLGVNIDEQGFIKVDRNQATNVPGVFAAGDCCDNPTKRVVTAMADGSKAAEFAYEYIKSRE